jgi:hypothetical protein
MNKIIKYGLCGLITASSFGCRDFSKDYQIKDKYNGYNVIARHDEMGYSVAICDSSFYPIISADNIRKDDALPDHYNDIKIRSFGKVSQELAPYMSLDSMRKIDEYLINQNDLRK